MIFRKILINLKEKHRKKILSAISTPHDEAESAVQAWHEELKNLSDDDLAKCAGGSSPSPKQKDT